MRAFLLLVIILSAPFVSKAQDASLDFQQGSFRLEHSTGVQRGLIRPGSKGLVVKQYANGPSTKYPWEEVSSYCLGLQKFVKASGFLIKSSTGWSNQLAKEEFVELLDSGTVSLMRYNQFHANQMGGTHEVLYLLKRSGEPDATAIPFSVLDGAGRKFRDFIGPYITTRPDLVTVLNAKKVTIYNLQTLLHAFNNQEPFLNYPMPAIADSKQ